MPSEDIQFGVTVAAPGADSNEYTLFDNTAMTPPVNLAQNGIDRIQVSVPDTAGSCSLKSYWKDKAGNWNLNSTTAVAAHGGLTGSAYDFETVGFPEGFKVTWVNGGSAQTAWPPSVTGSRGQKASGV